MSASESSEAETPVPVTYPSPHLGWAIAVTMLCFLPLGAMAIFEGFRTVSATNLGDRELAHRRSRAARLWIIAAIVVGFLIDGLVTAVFLLLGAFPK